MAQTFFKGELQGRVVNGAKPIPDVHVMNTTAKKATITNSNGNFDIQATLGDTILFSAVQFKRKTLVIYQAMLNSKFVTVPLEEFVNELDEVVVRPYDLSGDLNRDMQRLNTGPVITASTLGLPNADVKPLMQSERLLREAAMPPFHIGMLTGIPFNPLINAISGRTKMLKKRVARDRKYVITEEIRRFYTDSLFVTQLKIPKARIDDFMYFCEVDPAWETLAQQKDKISIWDFMIKKSAAYRENNKME